MYNYWSQDYYKLLQDIEIALADEKAAAKFYEMLMDMAPNNWQRDEIKHARDDEMKHYHMLHQLYVNLTGREPVVKEKEVKVTNYCEGLKDAFDDELEAADFYRSMMLSTYYQYIRDILFEIMTDEMEHATRFVFVSADAKC